MTGMDAILMYLLMLLSSLAIHIVSGLICYECDNRDDIGCGVHFKTYQFKPVNCGNSSVKCAVQRQPPGDKDWIGILRGCYRLGQLPGINETNGCRHWENAEGFTALYCFCDTDYCNSAPSKISAKVQLLILVEAAACIAVSTLWL